MDRLAYVGPLKVGQRIVVHHRDGLFLPVLILSTRGRAGIDLRSGARIRYSKADIERRIHPWEPWGTAPIRQAPDGTYLGYRSN